MTKRAKTRQGVKPKTVNGHKPTSDFIGVSWHTGINGHKSGWRMDIGKDRKHYYAQFGPTQEDELEAALAYNEKAIELYGKEAKLN